MMQLILTILVGLLGGVAGGLQAPLAGEIGQRLGGMSSSFIVHLSGAVVSGVLLLLLGGERIGQWRTLPWYMLGVGAFGVVLILTLSVTLPRLGGAMMITLLIVGQLLIGLVIDHFGWLGVEVRPIEFTRVLGLAILVLGAYLIAR